MRITHVVCTSAFAGVERLVAGLANEHAKAGHEVTVIGGNARAMRRAMPNVRHLSADTVQAAARRLHAGKVPDIVNAHLTAAEVAAVGSIGWLRPVVSTRHIAARRGGSSALAAVVAGNAARGLAGQIAVSEFVAKHVEGSCRIIVSGVPSQPDALRFPERRKALLIAQRLEPEKSTEVAIEGYLLSQARRNGIHLLIAGDGTQKQLLQDMVRKRGASESVHFLGIRSDIDLLFRHCAALIGPTSIEGLGLSVLEAMAHGTPVVAAASAGHLETVGTVEGARMFRPGDAYHLAEELDGLLLDPGASERYSHELQNTQRRDFTLLRQAKQTEEFYAEILSHRG